MWSAEEDFYEPVWTSCVIDWFVAGGVSDTGERAYAVIAHIDCDGSVTFTQTITNPTETTSSG